MTRGRLRLLICNIFVAAAFVAPDTAGRVAAAVISGVWFFTAHAKDKDQPA